MYPRSNIEIYSMMPLLMFQIQCLCKVTIVYVQSQVSAAIQISRVTFRLHLTEDKRLCD